MLDARSFHEIKEDCIAFLLESSLPQYIPTMQNTYDIYQLLCFLLSQEDILSRALGKHGFLASLKSTLDPFSKKMTEKQDILRKALQRVCNTLMRIQLECAMKKNPLIYSEEVTLQDWSRNNERDWKANNVLFSSAGDLSTFKTWLHRHAGITSELLKKLIIKFANQNYWLQPASIVQELFFSRQGILLLDSETPRESKDSFCLVSCGLSKLTITTERYFYRLLSSTDTPSLLNPACSFKMEFEINIVNASPVVSSFSMTTENLPSELEHPSLALAYYFLDLNQPRSQTPPPDWVWSPPPSPIKVDASPHREFFNPSISSTPAARGVVRSLTYGAGATRSLTSPFSPLRKSLPQQPASPRIRRSDSLPDLNESPYKSPAKPK